MKRNTLLSEVQPACLEMQGLGMHFRYIQNDGIAAVLKASVETQELSDSNNQKHGKKTVIKNLHRRYWDERSDEKRRTGNA